MWPPLRIISGTGLTEKTESEAKQVDLVHCWRKLRPYRRRPDLWPTRKDKSTCEVCHRPDRSTFSQENRSMGVVGAASFCSSGTVQIRRDTADRGLCKPTRFCQRLQILGLARGSTKRPQSETETVGALANPEGHRSPWKWFLYCF